MDLMAKMLKDIHTKQMMKKHSSDSHKTGSSKYKRNDRNDKRTEQMMIKVHQYDSNFIPNSNRLASNGGKSRNSDVPLLKSSGRDS
jgi:hypothetical protein